MPLDKPEELPNLVRLRLPANFLQIDKFGDLRVSEDVMAPADSRQPKAKRRYQSYHVVKADILRTSQDSLEQLARIHRCLPPRPSGTRSCA